MPVLSQRFHESQQLSVWQHLHTHVRASSSSEEGTKKSRKETNQESKEGVAGVSIPQLPTSHKQGAHDAQAHCPYGAKSGVVDGTPSAS